MNKKIFTLICLSLLAGVAVAQSNLVDYNEKRLAINESGMLVLGSWALLNIASSPLLASRADGHRKAFHQMNGYWNAVNLVIAGFGYFNAIKGDVGLLLSESIKEQHSIEKILLFNAALDLGYITGGFLMKERSKSVSKHSDRLKGFGNSLILQGAFLFVFDVSLYLFHLNHSELLYNWVDQVAIGPTGFNLTWKI